MELSINERAASFIWRKCERDEKSQSPTYDRDTDKFTCLVCGYVGYAEHYTRHGLEAPDMSLPANYMRALEALLPKGYTVDFEYAFGHYECCIERQPTTIADWPGSGPTIGHAVTVALAALHDAEAGDSR